MPRGDYDHIKGIGRGSYGEVSLVRSRVDSKKVALQMPAILAQLSSNPG